MDGTQKLLLKMVIPGSVFFSMKVKRLITRTLLSFYMCVSQVILERIFKDNMILLQFVWGHGRDSSFEALKMAQMQGLSKPHHLPLKNDH